MRQFTSTAELVNNITFLLDRRIMIFPFLTIVTEPLNYNFTPSVGDLGKPHLNLFWDTKWWEPVEEVVFYFKQIVPRTIFPNKTLKFCSKTCSMVDSDLSGWTYMIVFNCSQSASCFKTSFLVDEPTFQDSLSRIEIVRRKGILFILLITWSKTKDGASVGLKQSATSSWASVTVIKEAISISKPFNHVHFLRESVGKMSFWLLRTSLATFLKMYSKRIFNQAWKICQ